MSEKQAKKLNRKARKLAKANWMEYVSAICQWSFRVRLRFARDILFHAKRYRKVKR